MAEDFGCAGKGGALPHNQERRKQPAKKAAVGPHYGVVSEGGCVLSPPTPRMSWFRARLNSAKISSQNRFSILGERGLSPAAVRGSVGSTSPASRRRGQGSLFAPESAVCLKFEAGEAALLASRVRCRCHGETTSPALTWVEAGEGRRPFAAQNGESRKVRGADNRRVHGVLIVGRE